MRHCVRLAVHWSVGIEVHDVGYVRGGRPEACKVAMVGAEGEGRGM